MTAIIESPDYEETRVALTEDHIIKQMAEEMVDAPPAIWESMLDSEGHPTFAFMGMANTHYRNEGGTIPHHIGGPAEAIVRLVNKTKEES